MTSLPPTHESRKPSSRESEPPKRCDFAPTDTRLPETIFSPKRATKQCYMTLPIHSSPSMYCFGRPPTRDHKRTGGVYIAEPKSPSLPRKQVNLTVAPSVGNENSEAGSAVTGVYHSSLCPKDAMLSCLKSRPCGSTPERTWRFARDTGMPWVSTSILLPADAQHRIARQVS